jgi:hypothetical protein
VHLYNAVELFSRGAGSKLFGLHGWVNKSLLYSCARQRIVEEAAVHTERFLFCLCLERRGNEVSSRGYFAAADAER